MTSLDTCVGFAVQMLWLDYVSRWSTCFLRIRSSPTVSLNRCDVSVVIVSEITTYPRAWIRTLMFCDFDNNPTEYIDLFCLALPSHVRCEERFSVEIETDLLKLLSGNVFFYVHVFHFSSLRSVHIAFVMLGFSLLSKSSWAITMNPVRILQTH